MQIKESTIYINKNNEVFIIYSNCSYLNCVSVLISTFKVYEI